MNIVTHLSSFLTRLELRSITSDRHTTRFNKNMLCGDQPNKGHSFAKLNAHNTLELGRMHLVFLLFGGWKQGWSWQTICRPDGEQRSLQSGPPLINSILNPVPCKLENDT